MSKNISYKDAAEFFRTHDNYYILIHQNPDGDAVGSGFGLCFALRLLGKKANVMCSDPIPEKYSYILKDYEPQKFNHKTTVSTDLPDVKLLGMCGGFLGADSVVFIVMVGAVTGLAWGLFRYIILRKREWSIPYGPFLGLGGLAWMCFGNWFFMMFGK